MLQEAISDLNGREIPEVKDTQVDLPVNAFIPGTWISNKEEKLEAYKTVTNCLNNEQITELATDWVSRYGLIPEPVESLLLIMKLKLIAKKCGFMSIKLKKPNILLSTRMKINVFKQLKEELPTNIQNKFVFQSESEVSRIIIRGLGVLDTQIQIENLITWFSIMSVSAEKLLTQEIKV